MAYTGLGGVAPLRLRLFDGEDGSALDDVGEGVKGFLKLRVFSRTAGRE